MVAKQVSASYVERALKDSAQVQKTAGGVGPAGGASFARPANPKSFLQYPSTIVTDDDSILVVGIGVVTSAQVDILSGRTGGHDGALFPRRSIVNVADEAHEADFAGWAYPDSVRNSLIPTEVIDPHCIASAIVLHQKAVVRIVAIRLRRTEAGDGDVFASPAIKRSPVLQPASDVGIGSFIHGDR